MSKYRKITLKVPADVYEFVEQQAKLAHVGLQHLAGVTFVQGLNLILEKQKELKEQNDEQVSTETEDS
jgi:hypothetical protein